MYVTREAQARTYCATSASGSLDEHGWSVDWPMADRLCALHLHTGPCFSTYGMADRNNERKKEITTERSITNDVNTYIRREPNTPRNNETTTRTKNRTQQRKNDRKKDAQKHGREQQLRNERTTREKQRHNERMKYGIKEGRREQRGRHRWTQKYM